MPFQYLADIRDIPPGGTLYLRLPAGPVVLARIQDKVYALHGICPHKHNPLEGATLIDHLLDCPWHHFQYDVRTGANHYPANVYPEDLPRLRSQLDSLRTYPVDVRGTEIWVDLE